MITFSYDEKMYEIKRFSKVQNLKTIYDYRIYGLKNEQNPPILIEYNYNLFPFGFIEEQRLTKFFKKNGIKIEFKNDKYVNRQLVSIGIRNDLRKSTNLCCCIIQSIIFYLENKTDLLEESPIPGIQRFQ